MATDTEFEELVKTVRDGELFEALRASRQLAELARKRRKSTDELIRDAVTSAAEALRQKGPTADLEEIIQQEQTKAKAL